MLWGYGEDFLTLKALTDGLDVLVKELSIQGTSRNVEAFYRCSFGRGGSPSFGEFDFILMTPGHNKLYLGESKWDGRKRHSYQTIKLDDSQSRRHAVMSEYIKYFYSAGGNLQGLHRVGIQEPSEDTLLYATLQNFKRRLKQVYLDEPEIVNVLLYFYDEKLLTKPGARSLSPMRRHSTVYYPFGIQNQPVPFEVVPMSYTTENADGPFFSSCNAETPTTARAD